MEMVRLQAARAVWKFWAWWGWREDARGRMWARSDGR